MTSEIERYESFRDEIFNLFYDQKIYDGCLKKCEELNIILINDNNQDMLNFWLCKLMMARCYNRMNKNMKAKDLLIECIELVKNDKKRKYDTEWTLARLCGEEGDIENCIKYFNNCINYCTEVEDKYNFSKLLNMKAWYIKDSKIHQNESLKCALDAYKIQKTLYEKIDETTIIEKNLDNLIDETLDTLFNIYIILPERRQEAFRTLEVMKNAERKKELRKLLIAK